MNKTTKTPVKFNIDYKEVVRQLFGRAYDSLAYRVSGIMDNNMPYQEREKRWHYVPSNFNSIVELLEVYGTDLKGKSFIDVGAGTSAIPKIFKMFGCEKAVGLEYNNVLVLLDTDHMLIEGDMLTYDFKEYDILYSYNPLKCTKLMTKGLENVINTMKVGAKFYFQPASSLPLDRLGFKKCKECPYLYVYTKS